MSVCFLDGEKWFSDTLKSNLLTGIDKLVNG